MSAAGEVPDAHFDFRWISSDVGGAEHAFYAFTGFQFRAEGDSRPFRVG